MFPDPIVMHVDGQDQPHVRTQIGNGIGEFRWNDSSRVVTIKQTTNTKRFRREVRVAHSQIVEDPLNALNAEAGVSVYLVIDEPRYGFNDTMILNMVKDLTAFLADNGGANATKVLTGEF